MQCVVTDAKGKELPVCKPESNGGSFDDSAWTQTNVFEWYITYLKNQETWNPELDDGKDEASVRARLVMTIANEINPDGDERLRFMAKTDLLAPGRYVSHIDLLKTTAFGEGVKVTNRLTDAAYDGQFKGLTPDEYEPKIALEKFREAVNELSPYEADAGAWFWYLKYHLVFDGKVSLDCKPEDNPSHALFALALLLGNEWVRLAASPDSAKMDNWVGKAHKKDPRLGEAVMNFFTGRLAPPDDAHPRVGRNLEGVSRD